MEGQAFRSLETIHIPDARPEHGNGESRRIANAVEALRIAFHGNTSYR